jgi:hypothetical protein
MGYVGNGGWRIQIVQSERNEGLRSAWSLRVAIKPVVAIVLGGSDQTTISTDIGLLYNSVSYKVVSIKLIHVNHQLSQAPLNPGKPARNGVP